MLKSDKINLIRKRFSSNIILSGFNMAKQFLFFVLKRCFKTGNVAIFGLFEKPKKKTYLYEWKPKNNALVLLTITVLMH